MTHSTDDGPTTTLFSLTVSLRDLLHAQRAVAEAALTLAQHAYERALVLAALAERVGCWTDDDQAALEEVLEAQDQDISQVLWRGSGPLTTAMEGLQDRHAQVRAALVDLGLWPEDC
ncbi:hypothetical protein [Thermorudis peleae]|uniref:hypothetical protein n=1 Tax=Thermorudis peleae TaxID=1382356 RepID=UPI00056E9157|nr:hypothetical protein [Thermorudis peleae]